MQFIDLKAQYAAVREHVARRMQRVLDHGQYIMGPEVAELEDALATRTSARHCITVSSGTEALLISLMALDIGAGDEVITTPFTFAATAEVIALLGARPVWVDVEVDTGLIDAAQIAAAITPCTRAIIPVSLYGQPPDMDAICAAADAGARQHGIRPIAVIEDAAQSFGAQYQGRASCNLSTLGCTSFFPSKPLGCYGDGGAIFTSDDALAQACRDIRIHGQSARYTHTRIGVGGRMDTLQCAIVLAKLERFDWEVQQRQALGARYNQLCDQAGIARMQQYSGRSSVFAQYTVRLTTTNPTASFPVHPAIHVPLQPGDAALPPPPTPRKRIQAQLQAVGIPTAVHYPLPLNQQPAYRGLCDRPTPIAAQLAQEVLSLPMSADLTHAQQDAVIHALHQALAEGATI